MLNNGIAVAEPSLKGASVLLVGGDPAYRSRLRSGLGKHVALVDSAEGALKAGQLMERCKFEFLVVDAGLADVPALEWVDGVLRRGGSATLPTILVAADRPDAAFVMAAKSRGVVDVLAQPLAPEDVLSALRRHVVVPAASPAPARPAAARVAASRERELIGDSVQMCQVRELIRRVAPLRGTVLVEGETGTGKELVARWLHLASGRRGAFVAVNCGAIAPDLLESELFGHTKGAFTSAHQGREGLFIAAREGTLYLDEVSEMPYSLQVKLLRVLEEGRLRPVGADQELPVDARIVASTQHELAALVRERRFREDLYFRLNVAQINLPALRDRPEDILPLVRHFMDLLSRNLGVEPLELDAADLDLLRAHAWPGNVRELKNIIERALMLGVMNLDPLAPPGRPREQRPVAEYPLDWTLEEVKEHHMARVLRAMGGNKSAAARRLGVSRKTLERRLQLGPSDTDFA